MQMEDVEESISTMLSLDEELELDDLLRLEKRLKGPRWRERAETAHFAASTLVKDGYLRHVTTKDGLSAGASHVIEVYNKLLRQLLHGLALKDSHWQVRAAAVESATTVLIAARTALPVDKFEEYVWVVLAACLDVQPEVQQTASNCILHRLLVSSSPESRVMVVKLYDHFIEAVIAADSLPLKSSKISTKSVMTGLDNLPNGEILLAGMTAAICLQLLPLPASDGVRRQKTVEPDRLPLLLVVVAVALEDASRRQSRMMAGGLSRLLRSLGKPFYRESLVAMFNVMGPVYLSGPDLARTYQNAGIINEDIADVVKNLRTVTILNGMCHAFEASYVHECWADVVKSNNLSASQSGSTSGFSEGEIIALRQIGEMLRVPEDLTKTQKGQDVEAKAFEFAKSAMPLFRISISIIKNKNSVRQDQLLPEKIVQDLLLCCAAFAGGDGKYGGPVMWTSKELRELSMTLLLCLSDVHPDGATKVPNRGALKNSVGAKSVRLISGQISSLLPKIKQIIQDSSGSPGNDEILNKLSPEGTLGSSIVAAHQMRWVLSQLEHPNLGPYCQLVMPCVLTALDHFSPEVKRQGMMTCIHLAQNMNPTELRWYRDVTLDAVARNLVGCEDLWPVAVKMAVTTVTRIEERNPRGSWSGRIFSEMLEELARHRDDQSMRVVWLQEISPHMEALGLFLVAHFKKLLPLLFHWLHAPDDLTCILTLTKLQTVIICTWPRIPAHGKRLWKEVMRTSEESRNRKASSDIQAAVVEVYKLLYSCAGPTFEKVLLQDGEDGSVDELVTFMKQVKTETVVQV